jgi:condensin-2 complex subunit G2
MLVFYGELYHAAWKRGAGPVLRALEVDCVQDLANRCIHAATPALASSLRKVLGVLHQHKKYRAVDEMLHRVYEPILWRSLKVANAAVRRQAALLFVDAFPVQDPDAANADFEQARRPARRPAPPRSTAAQPPRLPGKGPSGPRERERGR